MLMYFNYFAHSLMSSVLAVFPPTYSFTVIECQVRCAHLKAGGGAGQLEDPHDPGDPEDLDDPGHVLELHVLAGAVPVRQGDRGGGGGVGQVEARHGGQQADSFLPRVHTTDNSWNNSNWVLV